MEYPVCSNGHICYGTNQTFCKLCKLQSQVSSLSLPKEYAANDKFVVATCLLGHKTRISFSHKLGCNMCYLIDKLNQKFGNNMIVPFADTIYINVNQILRFHCNRPTHPNDCNEAQCIIARNSRIKNTPVCFNLITCDRDFYARPIDLLEYYSSADCANDHFNKNINVELWALKILERIFDERFDDDCTLAVSGYNNYYKIAFATGNPVSPKMLELSSACGHLGITLIVLSKRLDSLREVLMNILPELYRAGLITEPYKYYEEQITKKTWPLREQFKCRWY